MVDKTSFFHCFQHQLRLFIECKIVLLRWLSIDYFEQVILKVLLLPNSNIEENLVTSRVHTAGLMGKDYLILMTIEYKSC